MQQFCYLSWIKWPRHKIVVGSANRQFTQRPWWTIRDQTGMPISKNGVMRMRKLLLLSKYSQEPLYQYLALVIRASSLILFIFWWIWEERGYILSNLPQNRVFCLVYTIYMVTSFRRMSIFRQTMYFCRIFWRKWLKKC